MLYTGIKGYFKKMIIYFKSWRILLLLLITVYMIVVDQSTNYLINYNIAYVLWMLFYSQSASKKPKEWKMLSLLPSDARLRTVLLISEAIGMTILLIVWRISMYIIELLLNLCTIQSAVDKFFSLDLIIILLISMVSRISASKANIRNTKHKKIENTVLILSSILLCTHIILFILKIDLGWLSVAFMTLAYVSIAAFWYVVLLGLRDCNFDYETMTAKPVKQ